MIQFNLLPHREALRKFKQDQFKASLVLTVLLGVITALALYGWLVFAIAAQKSNITVLEQEIERYQAHITEIKNVNNQIDTLLARQKAVEDIQADRNVPVRLLSELASSLPEGVVLTKMAQKGQDLTLEGTAQTNENLSQFLYNLSQGGSWFFKPELLVSESQNFNPSGQLPGKAFRFSLKVIFLRTQSASPGVAAPQLGSGAWPMDAASAFAQPDAPKARVLGIDG
ncbi:MAG: PilN domain-containing protein [Burkholderiaceae bacterium]